MNEENKTYFRRLKCYDFFKINFDFFVYLLSII